MTGFLLLDLDGTLLENLSERFLPAYLQAISQYMADIVPPDRFVQALMVGTEKMVKNLRPDLTLKQVFSQFFYPELGIEQKALDQRLDTFYQQVFPQIKQVTALKPEAKGFVDGALAAGFQIVIATTPLFPLVAIQERLAWAGFPVADYSFKLITSFEKCHFSKPHPEYYAEILAQLGWPDGAIVSIGDDFKQDITPSKTLGLPVYWVQSEGSPATNPSVPQGSLKQAWSWITSSSPGSLVPDFETLKNSLAILRSTPAALSTWGETIGTDDWNLRPKPDEWALVEIVCHIRDIEQEINLPRLRKTLTMKHPHLTGQDTNRWADERGYLQESGPKALQEFIAARIELINLLENLSPDDWQKTARHTILGRTTIEEQVRIAAAHERLHVRDFVRIASTGI